MDPQYSWSADGRSASSKGESSGTSASTVSSEHETHEPARPTRSEYAAYAAMLGNLEARAESRLAQRLVAPMPSRSSKRLQALALSSLLPDGDELLQTHRRSSRDRIPRHIELSTRWPLAPSQLPCPPLDLNEAILSFAHAYIRQNKLILPEHEHTIDQEVEQYPPLPETLVSSTRQMVNQTLVSLAACRPPLSRKRARKMEPMGWKAVLGATSAINGHREAVSAANIRLRRMYRVPAVSEDLLELRLKILSDCRTALPLRADLYAPMLPKKPNATRRHQTQAELIKREEKRILRLEKKAEKVRQREVQRKRRRRRPTAV